MVPSEAEIEARLAELRRRREAIDREIADHLLYLELGRRLRTGAAMPEGVQMAEPAEGAGRHGGPAAPGPSGPAVPRRAEAGDAPEPSGPAPVRRWPAPDPDPGTMPPGSGSPGPSPGPTPWTAPRAASEAASEASSGTAPGAARGWPAPADRPSPPDARPDATPDPPPAPRAHPSAAGPGPGPEGPPPPIPFDEDPAAARRYGRALVAAAVAVLAEVGRPMHAGEILEHLAARGFGVPGQDPVAALNTRLWKRSGPGGPLRRLGDAVYDRAGPA
jgi:hypothetical protein